MSMVVQHNMQAANANRMLGVTTSAQSKSTEKLSSGYKINRAADDAAGLSISEKMRKQIRGLDKASSNAQDGVSAVQTAEGALTEVHSMLQRMNELATQAANGTNSDTDRSSIQDEIDQLTTEIDRVSETTKFNETYLLKGDSSGTTTTKTINAHDAGLAGKLGKSEDGVTKFTADKLAVGDKTTIGGVQYNIVDSSKTTDYTSIKEYTPTAGDVLEQDGKKYKYVANAGTTPSGQTAAAAGWFAEDNTTTAADTVTIKEGSTFLANTVNAALMERPNSEHTCSMLFFTSASSLKLTLTVCAIYNTPFLLIAYATIKKKSRIFLCFVQYTHFLYIDTSY